ncbi:MAG: hypothetical protein ACREPM_04210, partial [Gemmatimonadaceae bacterium]
MKRRRLVALVAVIVLAVLGLAAVGAVFLVTRTDTGRGWVRRFAQPIIASKIAGGTLYIGKISGSFINELTIDSIAIREKHTNDLFLSTGRVTVRYDIRDIIDLRLWVRAARVEHPYVHIVQHANGVWNFKEIFASPNTNEPPKPKDEKQRGLGDYFVIDSAYTRDGQFVLTLPWEPDKALRGAARDSVIRVHLKDSAKAVSRTYDGFGRTYAWKNGHGLLVHARIADPDSDVKFGRQFIVDTLSVDEYEPTFKFRKLSAQVQHRGDSVWFQVPHFEMPASVGNGTGKIWWGSDRPVRYDVSVHGDSVALDDVNWVYPTLPRTGGGSLDLLIKNDAPPNEQIVNFKLVKMDVHSTKSHLTGDMSFGTGAPLLLVRNVDLRADPVNFDLLRTLAGKPFTQDWQGDLYGTVKGRGGPLTNFVVDQSEVTFRDAHVPGAVSHASGQGELDILEPAFTVFHGFHVDAPSLDLRTIEYLFPNFPRLGGFASGTATLDSSWLDVRFTDANVALQDGPGDPSRFTGSGRITYGDEMTYDVSLQAEPLSLTMLARSPTVFPAPFFGLVSGPLRAHGTTQDLAVQTSLQGAMGALTFDGRVDLDSIGGYGVHGHGEFSAFNVATLLQSKTIPGGLLSGHYDVDAAGETAATTAGSAEISLERTTFDSVRVYESQAHVHFAGGKMSVDSLRLHTAAATLTASGALGLPKGTPDTITFKVTVDSLGGLRPLPFLSTADSLIADGAAAPVDSLSGSGTLNGKAYGTMDLLNLSGRLDASNLYINKDRGEHLGMTFDLRNVVNSVSGDVHIGIDTVTLAGIELDSVAATFQLTDPEHRRFSGVARSSNGPAATAAGVWNTTSGVDSVRFDDLRLAIGNDRWSLTAPSRLRRDSTGFTIDSLLLRNRDSSSIAFVANVPNTGPAFTRLRATNVGLQEFGLVEQFTDSLTGLLNLTVAATGTKLAPDIAADASLSGVTLRGVDIDRVVASARYNAGRAKADLLMTRQGKRAVVVSASLPATVTLFGLHEREDSVSGFLQADTTDLSLIKTLVPNATKLKVGGHLVAHITLGGTWRNKILRPDIAIADGSVSAPQLGDVTISKINGTITGRGTAAQDSIAVDLHAVGDGKPAGSLALTGYVKNLLQTTAPQVFGLKLSASTFHAFDRRTVADLTISTAIDSLGRRTQDPLQLTGTSLAPVLSGSILVDRGSIFIADRDLARKQAADVLADSLNLIDTTTRARPRWALFTTLMTNLRTRNATVTLGDNVRLRSTEADVRLVGQLNLLTSSQTTRLSMIGGPPLQLEGTLRTAGGSYNLNLGLLQREFQVLSDGTVTFDGAVENPLLDIRALYNV